MARQHILRDIATNNLDPKVKYISTRNGKLAMKHEAHIETESLSVEVSPEKPVEKPVAKKPAVKAQKAEEPAKPAPKADEKKDG